MPFVLELPGAPVVCISLVLVEKAASGTGEIVSLQEAKGCTSHTRHITAAVVLGREPGDSIQFLSAVTA